MPNADIVALFWLIQQTCRLVTMRPAGGCRRLIDTPPRHRTFPGMNSKMTANHPVGDLSHTFLKPQEVIARFRWGHTRGYLELKQPTFPRPIGGNYRLDTIMAWEEWCLTPDHRPLVDTPGRHRTFPVMNSKMTTNHPVGDPRHTFLKAQEVIARYRWGRTRGYLELKKPRFPRPMGGNYRLDTIMAWEEWCLTLDQPCQRETVAAIPVLEPVTAPAPSADPVTTTTHDRPAELPQRSQSRRRRAA